MLLSTTYQILENQTKSLKRELNDQLAAGSLEDEDREMFERVLNGLTAFTLWTERRALEANIKARETALAELKLQLHDHRELFERKMNP